MKKILKILLGLVACLMFSTQTVQAKENIPTLFVHGWGSSYRAEEHMVKAALKAKVTKTVVRIDVDVYGQAHLVGNLPKNAKDPLVEINFENNKDVNAMMEAQYLKTAVELLQTKYKFKKLNFVGHSMGNSAILFYLRDNAGDPNLPKLNEQVALAAFPNGLVDQMPAEVTLDQAGKPSVTAGDFENFLVLRETYPAGAKVLNIYGDVLDGSKSDGPVPVRSAQTLRYLVSPRAKSYQEKEIRGKMGQHSKLHNNSQVDRALIKFLWGK
ncbi:cell surface hydrolase [Ligilactobacillus murinus DSM 20452 = NBRC 14221]|uniref:Cell surface hydrolase n=2 Tax=Ligilactobacillus murinus TaxID=1622 RepID=A0A0R2BCC7_9LACO|nr:cell surface hydrolase [Ligilactobacillus murinus DSM 20452 = NBRC 14221]